MSWSREAETESDWNALNPPERPQEHELKCWSEFYVAVERGDKTFEVRKNDRHFRVGDVLRLREWLNVDGGHYTGREVRRKVTYLLDGGFGLKPGFVCMALGLKDD